MTQDEQYKTCPDCGGTLVWGIEYTGLGATPESTGFDIEYCEICGKPTGDRHRVGF